MLNYIWGFFLVSAFLSAVVQGDMAIWHNLSEAIFNSAKSAFSIAINLTGILCFWLGIMKIAEQSGITQFLARLLKPLFRRIMPEIKPDSPALGTMVMNMAANILGLDNAATPMGLKAMEELQHENPNPHTASNAQILFMVINSSSITLLPITILMYRSEMGCSNVGAVFLPILLATSASTLVGFLSVAVIQKINLFNRVIIAYLGGAVLLITLILGSLHWVSAELRSALIQNGGDMVMIGIIGLFVVWGYCRKVKVYDEFIRGASEGFNIAVAIIPYLVAMLVAIAVFRTSGMLDFLLVGLQKILTFFNINADFVPALPTALLKPLSGSGARAMMIETMQNYGADSFPAFVSAVVQGSTETTFYVLAVYFGAVKITNTRHALPCALLADFVGIVVAMVASYYFYAS